MTEGSLEAKVSQLAKRIDDQARFTRAVTVICTTAVLGVMFYMLSEIFGTLPPMVVTSFMGQMDTVVSMWNATEARARRPLAPAPTVLPDLCDVCGLAQARRALEIAAAGQHSLFKL